jgi:hypothetical protein
MAAGHPFAPANGSLRHRAMALPACRGSGSAFTIVAYALGGRVAQRAIAAGRPRPGCAQRQAIQARAASMTSHSVTMAAARALGARGLPTTLIVTRDGVEASRVQGETEWDDPAMVTLIRAIGGRAAATAPVAVET